MDYAIFALYGFTILVIIYIYYLYKNLKQNNLIIFGSLLVTVGYITINHILFELSSFVFPINTRVKQTDILHFILRNSNFGYQELANICLTIYYSLYTYRNGMKNTFVDNMQAIGGGLFLIFYIKKSIDNWYIKKEKNYLGIYT